jgi:hypothetical protein
VLLTGTVGHMDNGHSGSTFITGSGARPPQDALPIAVLAHEARALGGGTPFSPARNRTGPEA